MAIQSLRSHGQGCLVAPHLFPQGWGLGGENVSTATLGPVCDLKGIKGHHQGTSPTHTAISVGWK